MTLAADLPSDAPTVEDIAAVAEANGIGEAFRQLLDAGRRHGLPLRPYRVKVMVTLPTNRNRMLYTVDAQSRDGRLHLYISPDAFAEAAGVPAEAQQLGASLDELLSR